MIRALLLLLSLASFLPAASGADGGLTPEILNHLRQSYQRDEVRINALAANPIDSLVLNRSVVAAHDKLIPVVPRAVMLAELMRQIPQHITSIPGIGLATGAAILSEIGDITRFESEEKLIAYAGIDATVYQSGQFQAAEAHMSKRGSPYLRHALWPAAAMAIRYDPSLKTYFDKKRTEGKAYGVALGAVCRKLLVRIYVILKEQRPYVIR